MHRQETVESMSAESTEIVNLVKILQICLSFGLTSIAVPPQLWGIICHRRRPDMLLKCPQALIHVLL